MYPYQVTQINENTWQIAEVYHTPAALPMYLVVGEKRAALIDSGIGFGRLRATVEEITSLPVDVYNTHAHLDHAAGNGEFDRVFMHPEEEIRARGAMPREDRIEFVELKCMSDPEREELVAYAREHMTEYDPEYDIYYVEEGELIDLGGLVLEPIHVPGHTSGSLVYLDRKNGCAFCGDSVNPRSSIGMFPGSPTVACYAQGLEHLLETAETIGKFFVGHRLYSFGREDVEDILECARQILAGDMGEPYPMIVSRKGPVWGRIHWNKGKRITFRSDCVR